MEEVCQTHCVSVFEAVCHGPRKNNVSLSHWNSCVFAINARMIEDCEKYGKEAISFSKGYGSSDGYMYANVSNDPGKVNCNIKCKVAVVFVITSSIYK